VVYTIIGGAGGQLESDRVEDWRFYNVTRNEHHFVILDAYPETLHWRAFNIQGHEIDSFQLSPNLA
jgi:hypothetical protein